MLSEQRKKIDQLDRELVKLLEERMSVVTEVAEIKATHDLEILDQQRENRVLDKVRSYVTQPEYAESIVALYAEMMEISKKYQCHIQNLKK